MTTIPCVPCCAVPTTTDIPGIQGNPGTDGDDGISAYAILGGAGLLAIPLDGANTPSLTFSGPGVAPTSWMVIGQYVILGEGSAALANPGPYTFQVASIDSPVAATLTRRAAANDGVSASVDVGAILSPVGAPAVLAAALPTAITDNSTGTASNTVAAGTGMVTIHFPQLFNGGTAQINPVLNFPMPYKFKIISWYWVTWELLAGGGGSRVANLRINGALVGTVATSLTITVAGASAVGTVVAGTAVSGANISGNPTDTLTVDIQAGGTAITAGEGQFVIVMQNMNTADAAASFADHINDLITSLT